MTRLPQVSACSGLEAAVICCLPFWVQLRVRRRFQGRKPRKRQNPSASRGQTPQVCRGGARDLLACAEAISVPSWQGCHKRPAHTRRFLGRRGTKTLRWEVKPASLPACDTPGRLHKREVGSDEPGCLSHSKSSRRGEPQPGNQLSTSLWDPRPPRTGQGLERQKLPVREKPHQCGQCVQEDFRVDIGPEDPHWQEAISCSQRGKAFTHSSQVTQAPRFHSSEKPVACARCGPSFSQSSSLTQYQPGHPREERYACQECAVPSALAPSSASIHTGEKPSECSCTFRALSDFFLHQRVHTAEKPFAVLSEQGLPLSSHLSQRR